MLAVTKHDLTTVDRNIKYSVKAGVHCLKLHEKHDLHELTEIARVDKRQALESLKHLLWLYKQERSPQQRRFTSRKHLSAVRLVNPVFEMTRHF